MESMHDIDPGELEAMIAAVDQFNSSLHASGAFVNAGGLQPPSTAITIDATGDRPERTSGPFVHASGYVGGFWIIDVLTEEQALVWAEEVSAALGSRIEVRAFQEESE